MQLSETIVVVTGAGRGIGRAIARALAAEGAWVALVSRTTSQLDETLDQISQAGGKAVSFPTDVSDQASVEATFKGIEAKMGPIDVLMNNAGSFVTIGPVHEVDPKTWWRDVTINLYGIFLCCHTVLPGMISRKKGRIINMVGGGTANPLPYGSGYASSKAAVMRLTECLAQEVKEYGIGVFAMRPGLVRTAMTEYQLTTPNGKKWLPRIKKMFDEGENVPPERAADLAVLLASGKLDALTGRLFSATEDLTDISDQIDAILKEDLRTLRIKG